MKRKPTLTKRQRRAQDLVEREAEIATMPPSRERERLLAEIIRTRQRAMYRR